MSTEISVKPLPPQLPASVVDLMAKRRNRDFRTLNDEVEAIYLYLYDNPEFKAFLYAVYDEQAVEGSLAADNIECARMIRQTAKTRGNVEVSRQKLATIVKALNVVLRRYNESRKERRDMIGGEIVPNPHDH